MLAAESPITVIASRAYLWPPFFISAHGTEDLTDYNNNNKMYIYILYTQIRKLQREKLEGPGKYSASIMPFFFFFSPCVFVCVCVCERRCEHPRRLTFMWWECWGICFWHKPAELAHSFLFCSCVYFSLYSLFNCISFHKISWQLSAFSLCSSCFISALMFFSTICLVMKVSFSPDIILCSWPGLKHQFH